jgi:hypothetical protein
VNVSLGAARRTRLETRVLQGEKGVARFVTDRRRSSTEVANLAERRDAATGIVTREEWWKDDKRLDPPATGPKQQRPRQSSTDFPI